MYVQPRSVTSFDACVEGQLELVVLDCGLAGSLSQADRVNFVTLLEAVARRRGKDAGRSSPAFAWQILGHVIREI